MTFCHSFAWKGLLRGCQSQPEVNSRSYYLGMIPPHRAHSLPTRLRAAWSVQDWGGSAKALVQPKGKHSWRLVPWLGFHLLIPCTLRSAKDQLLVSDAFSPITLGRSMQLVLSFNSLVLFLFCLWELFPWYHGKDLLNTTLLGGCIQSLNNWPEVWSSLSWIDAKEGLLTTTALLDKKLAAEEDLILQKSKFEII